MVNKLAFKLGRCRYKDKADHQWKQWTIQRLLWCLIANSSGSTCRKMRWVDHILEWFPVIKNSLQSEIQCSRGKSFYCIFMLAVLVCLSISGSFVQRNIQNWNLQSGLWNGVFYNIRAPLPHYHLILLHVWTCPWVFWVGRWLPVSVCKTTSALWSNPFLSNFTWKRGKHAD